LPRIFISHSSLDNVSAVAFKQWLVANSWPDEDIFLDVDSIGAGERWKEALRNANARCEAVILLASPDAFASPECLAEVRTAEDNGKEIIVVLLRDLEINDRRLAAFMDRQIVDLAAPPQTHVEIINYRDGRHEVRFNAVALANVTSYLFKRGITPDRFPWPPQDKPNAEPYPGLNAFTEEDAGIFFGRDADIMRGLDKLRTLRRNARPALLIIQAASGAGKSSYLRAGLWPRLDRDPDLAPLAILRPAQGILTGPEGLGGKLAAQLSRLAAPINPGEIHAQLMAADVSKAGEEFARLLLAFTSQAHEQRKIGDPNARPPAPIIAIDQAEELFASEDAGESQRFLLLFANLLRNPPPNVEAFGIMTIRSDSAARLFQAIEDLKLETPDTLPLLPVPRTSYSDVIIKPLEMVARRGQRLTISPLLTETLIADATGADALPLLAFTLSNLYREFGAGGSITPETYEVSGGVSGVIDMAVKRALAKPGDAPTIPAAKDQQNALLRATFIPWLARIDRDSGVSIRRVAQLDKFTPDSRAMLERLINKARLVVIDRRSGVDVAEVAHESVLRRWPPLAAWLKADQDDLRLVDGIEWAASEWIRNGRQAGWLDHRGERLRTAERLVKRQDFRDRLGADGIAYLDACRHAERVAQWRNNWPRAVAAGFAVAIIGLSGWLMHERLSDLAYWFTHVREYALSAASERAKKPRDPFKECVDCPEMIVVRPGKFNMGSPVGERGAEEQERPQHEVTITYRFAVAKYDTTFAEWDACVARGGCRSIDDRGGGRGTLPVIYVSWDDARHYVEWLSRVTGQPYRLLSEAEWEYAARADSTTRFYFGEDEGAIATHAWYAGNATGKTHPVGQWPSNDFGLFDMAGNVEEWCEDTMHDDYQGAPSDGSAWSNGNTSFHVLRGGSWYSVSADLRSDGRSSAQSVQIDNGIGFRVARTMLPPAP
jgi:formylglycine-generating enzyme required for sulfatase activity